MIKVSVIIPSYGIPVFLDKAIQSVLSQTMEDLELIIVDDNDIETEARKKTETLVAKYIGDERVSYIKHPRNQNGSAARNTGLAKAQGKYIAFLDSDDEYLPERLQKCFEVMETQASDVAGVYTGCEFRRGGSVYHVKTDVKPGNFLCDTLACTFEFCTGSNLFIRKTAADEINGFDESFLRHQDYEFLVRIFEKYSLAAIPEVLVVKNNENANLPDVNKMIDIKQQYLNKYMSVIETLNEKDRSYVFYSQCIQIAEAAMRSKKSDCGRQFINKAKAYADIPLKEYIRLSLLYFSAILVASRRSLLI